MFRLRVGSVRIVPVSAPADVLPGEVAPVLPYFAAVGVGVADVDVARDLVKGNGIATHDLPEGYFVSAADAHGAAVVFRQA